MSTTMFSSLDVSDKKRLIHELRDFYIPYRKSLDLPKYASFGGEIEFSIKGYDYSYKQNLKKAGYGSTTAFEFMNSIGTPKIWKIKDEIGSRIEVETDVLGDDKDTWDTLKYLLSFLIEKGAYYNGEGGSHVHAGMQIIGNDFEKWKLFLKLWACYEEEIIRFTNGEYYFDREKMNFYADRSKKIIFEWLNDEELQREKRITNKLTYQEQNIDFSNPNNIKKYISPDKYFNNDKNVTVEFRSPNLTLNHIIWQNNINLFIKMMLAVTKEDFDLEKLEYRYVNEKNVDILEKISSDEKAFELCDLIFDNDFDKHCFLRQYYKDFDIPIKENKMIKSKPFWR